MEFTSRVMRKGDSGKDVQFYQQQMNQIAGQGLVEDGQFGAATEQAVKNCQTVFGLGVDGILGPNTQRKLIEVALTT